MCAIPIATQNQINIEKKRSIHTFGLRMCHEQILNPLNYHCGYFYVQLISEKSI